MQLKKKTSTLKYNVHIVCLDLYDYLFLLSSAKYIKDIHVLKTNKFQFAPKIKIHPVVARGHLYRCSTS